MGMFDTFVEKHKEDIQVKCFDNTLKTYYVGNEVKSLQGYSTYYILDLYSEEFVFIKDNIFVGIIPILTEGDTTPVFNKFGNKLTCD